MRKPSPSVKWKPGKIAHRACVWLKENKGVIPVSSPNIIEHDYLICPWCNEDSGCRIDHLYDAKAFPSGGFGPWYCSGCRGAIEGHVITPGDVEVRRSDTVCTMSRSMALLRFDGRDGPVFFVMDHDRYRNGKAEYDADEANQEHQRYFFEEHSCPTNWLRECAAVIENGDCDPHGFLEFVRAVDVPSDFDTGDDENWTKLFPEAFDGESSNN